MKLSGHLSQKGIAHHLLILGVVVVSVAAIGAWRVYTSSALTGKYVIVKNSGKGAADNIRVNAPRQDVKVGSKVNSLELHGRVSVGFRGLPKPTYDNQELYVKKDGRYVHAFSDTEKGQYTVKYPKEHIGITREKTSTSGPTNVNLCTEAYVKLESYYVQACTLSNALVSIKAIP